MSREQFRYFTILNGTSLTNEDEAGIPNYYGYNRPGFDPNGQDTSSFVILQYNETAGTYRYYLGKGLSDYNTAWTNRTGLTYKKPGEFKKL